MYTVMQLAGQRATGKVSLLYVQHRPFTYIIECIDSMMEASSEESSEEWEEVDGV